MRVVVVGQKSFGAAALSAIVDKGHDVAAVWAPDDVGDRTLTTSTRLGLPTNIGPVDAELVRHLSAELIVCAHSHAFIGRKTRGMTQLGAIGYHPSLLPRHRGRDAVRWTIKMGDPIAGGTVYWLNDQVDGGPIAAQRWCWIRPGWDFHDLWKQELFPMGVELLCKVLEDLDAGIIREVPQDPEVATWEPSWEREPLFRPELPEIGNPTGYTVRATLEG